MTNYHYSRTGGRIYQGTLSWFGEVRDGADVVAETIHQNKELVSVNWRIEPTKELTKFVEAINE